MVDGRGGSDTHIVASIGDFLGPDSAACYRKTYSFNSLSSGSILFSPVGFLEESKGTTLFCDIDDNAW